MAEGGYDASLSTDGDERHHSPLALATDPTPACHGRELLDLGKEPKKEAPLSEDFKDGFTTTCEAVEERLFNLDKNYAIFGHHELQRLLEIAEELKEQKIFIGVVGHLNVGKSTLLNALLGARLLPMKKSIATRIKVYIQHDAGDSCLATSDQHPKLLIQKGKQVPPEEVVGATKIYKKLGTLNDEGRNGAEGHDEVFCTLNMNVPVLANAPPNCRVSLVDTPGTGDFKSHVAVAAEGALESSSAYVFITTYGELDSAEFANFIRSLHGHDQGVFKDRRLIIVVTQFDRVIEPDSTDDEITVKKVQEEVCQSVNEACSDVKMSHDDVLPLSGLWAYKARMLAVSRADEPGHREGVLRYLSNYQVSPCGQGETPSSDLPEQSDDQLVVQLLRISRFSSLEERIHSVTKSCIKVWVSKMKGDHVWYLGVAKDRLTTQYESELRQYNEQKEEHSQLQECLRVIDEEWHSLEEIMSSTLRADLEKMYPENLEASEALEACKQSILEEVQHFKLRCLKKVKDKEVTYGKDKFDADVRNFVDITHTGLERITNTTRLCTQLYNVLTVRMTELGASIHLIEEKAQQIRVDATSVQEHVTDNSDNGSTTQSSVEQPQRINEVEDSDGSTTQSSVEQSQRINEVEDSGEPHIRSSRFRQRSWSIPQVKVPWWRHLLEIFRKLMQQLPFGKPDASPASQPSYSSWNNQLQATVDKLGNCLCQECEDFFANIRKNIIQSFVDQYCHEYNTRSPFLDAECKPKIEDGRRWLQKLDRSLESSDRKMKELRELCEHLEKLSSHLHSKADDSISER